MTTLVPSIRNISATWNKSVIFVFSHLDHELVSLHILPFDFFTNQTIVVSPQTMISPKPKFDLQTRQKRNANNFSISHQQTKNIPKPQLKFTDKVNNNSLIPFISKLRSKPNARTPLPSSCRFEFLLEIFYFFLFIFLRTFQQLRFTKNRFDSLGKSS